VSFNPPVTRRVVVTHPDLKYCGATFPDVVSADVSQFSIGSSVRKIISGLKMMRFRQGKNFGACADLLEILP
jgi:hypothetical protein